MWNFNTMRYYLVIFSVLLVLSLYHFRGKKLNQYGKPEVLVTAGGFFVGNFSLKKNTKKLHILKDLGQIWRFSLNKGFLTISRWLTTKLLDTSGLQCDLNIQTLSHALLCSSGSVCYRLLG